MQTSSVTFHPSLHSDLRVSGQRQDAGSQFSHFKSTCSRSTPRPESHSFSTSHAQGLCEHVEEFEESTAAPPRTSYASVYSCDHAVHDRPHVPPAAPFVPAPAVRTDDLERRLRELSEENERLRRSQAESERRDTPRGTIRPTKAPWQMRLWVPSRRSGHPVPTPT